MSTQVQWCLEKALERTLVGDNSGALDYLGMAKLWRERTLVKDKVSKYLREE